MAEMSKERGGQGEGWLADVTLSQSLFVGTGTFGSSGAPLPCCVSQEEMP